MIRSKNPEARSPGGIALTGWPPESPGETDQKAPALAAVIALIIQGDSRSVLGPGPSSSKGEVGSPENLKLERPLVSEVSLGLTIWPRTEAQDVSKGGSEGGLWLSAVRLRLLLSDLLSPQPASGAH